MWEQVIARQLTMVAEWTPSVRPIGAGEERWLALSQQVLALGE